MARIAVLLLLCAPLVLAPVAAAQDDPFGPVPQAPGPQQPAPAPAPAEEDEGLSERQQLLIALAGIVLVSGIAVAILRDARRRAPDTDTRQALDSEGRPVKGSRTPPKQRVEHNRAKAKVARQARKRNR